MMPLARLCHWALFRLDSAIPFTGRLSVSAAPRERAAPSPAPGPHAAPQARADDTGYAVAKNRRPVTTCPGRTTYPEINTRAIESARSLARTAPRSHDLVAVIVSVKSPTVPRDHHATAGCRKGWLAVRFRIV